jgi:hypothetical protein
MEIRETDNIYILTPLSPKMDKRETQRLFSNITIKNKKIALDLAYVQDCTIDFLEKLKAFALDNEIGIFNIPSDLFTLFNFMGLDKSVGLFVSESDFVENARRLINRKFSVL